MGASLASILASDRYDISAVVLLAPYLRLKPAASRLARVGRLASLLVPYIDTRNDASILDPQERSKALGFGVTTPRLLGELRRVADRAWVAAPSVEVPTLMVQSTRDPRISPDEGERCFSRLGGRPKEMHWIENSGHVIAADRERQTVLALTAAWLERFSSTS